MKRVTLVIVHYNDPDNITELLNQVHDYDAVEHIVIVDNASELRAFQMLTKYEDSKVHIIRSEVNLGYAKGNNKGMKYAIQEWNPQYFVIANPDIRFTQELLEILFSVYDRIPNAGLVSARMSSPKTYAGCGAWKQPTIGMLIFNNFFVLKKLFGDRTFYKESELREELCKVDVIAGSFLICKSSVMQEVGMFDEYTFLYGEENIISMKLHQKGYQNYICNNISYEHKHSVSIDQNIDSVRKKFVWLYDSMVYYNKQYLHTNRIQDMLYSITFHLGLNTYLILKKILER